jgi:DNA-binding CsgD family transcriptional regulator/PAS domain-containing protein
MNALLPFGRGGHGQHRRYPEGDQSALCGRSRARRIGFRAGSPTDLLHGEHALIHGDAGNPVCITARIDERDLARSLAASAACSLGPLSHDLLPVRRAFTRSSVIPDREFTRTVFYNECIRPLNGFHSLSIRQIDLPTPVLFSVCRAPRLGDFAAEEAAVLQQLAPHLATVFDLHGRLQAANNQHLALAQVLDRMDCGVIVTDASARPVFVSQRALDITLQSDGLTLGPLGLSGPTPRTTQQLRAAIASVGAADASHHSRHLRLQRPSLRPPLLLTLLPIWRLGLDLPGVPAPRVAVFINDPEIPVMVDRVAVMEAYRLTPRESEIAVLLASGLDLADIAATLSTSRGTAGFHLKRVFEKTGAHSQARLVALMRGFNRSLN